MVKHGSYYRNVFNRKIWGFRGLGQHVAPLYPLDAVRVRLLDNYDVFNFTLYSRNGSEPTEQVDGRILGAKDSKDIRVIAYGNKCGVEKL